MKTSDLSDDAGQSAAKLCNLLRICATQVSGPGRVFPLCCGIQPGGAQAGSAEPSPFRAAPRFLSRRWSGRARSGCLAADHAQAFASSSPGRRGSAGQPSSPAQNLVLPRPTRERFSPQAGTGGLDQQASVPCVTPTPGHRKSLGLSCFRFSPLPARKPFNPQHLFLT